MKVGNTQLREEIYRSKLSFTDLTRQDQRALPFPDLYVDAVSDIPTGFEGLVKVSGGDYLPSDFKTPFEPFQLVRDGQVTASAFLRNGLPSVHGRLTDALGIMIQRLVHNYARKPSWSGYSYLDEMIGFAIEQAMVPVLRFDERKGSNPFSFLTTNTFYAFEKVRKREAALAKLRFKMVEAAVGECQWSAWKSDDNEADNSMSAIYDEMCAEMDLLLSDELIRARRYSVPPRVAKHSMKTSPLLAAVITYGFDIGLSGAAMAAHFGLDPTQVHRIKNNRAAAEQYKYDNGLDHT